MDRRRDAPGHRGGDPRRAQAPGPDAQAAFAPHRPLVSCSRRSSAGIFGLDQLVFQDRDGARPEDVAALWRRTDALRALEPAKSTPRRISSAVRDRGAPRPEDVAALLAATDALRALEPRRARPPRSDRCRDGALCRKRAFGLSARRARHGAISLLFEIETAPGLKASQLLERNWRAPASPPKSAPHLRRAGRFRTFRLAGARSGCAPLGALLAHLLAQERGMSQRVLFGSPLSAAAPGLPQSSRRGEARARLGERQRAGRAAGTKVSSCRSAGAARVARRLHPRASAVLGREAVAIDGDLHLLRSPGRRLMSEPKYSASGSAAS